MDVGPSRWTMKKCHLWWSDFMVHGVNRPLGVSIWVRGGMPIGAWLLSCFLLFKTRYVRYFMATRCMCFMSFF